VLFAQRGQQASAHEVIELVRPTFAAPALHQFLALVDQRRHMGCKQLREFQFERPAAIGFKVQTLEKQRPDLFEYADKLFAHDVLSSSCGKCACERLRSG